MAESSDIGLEKFIYNSIVCGDNSLGAYIPKIKPYLTPDKEKTIIKFIEEQQRQGVSFTFDNGRVLDIVGIFEASRLIYDYYQQGERVQRSEVKKLKEAIKICAQHITNFSSAYEFVFLQLLEIENKKYFTTDDIQNYERSFNKPFIMSLKKQSTKYPVLLFYEIMRYLDEINDKNYKNKNNKVSQSLENLIIGIFDLKTKKLRREDKKEYEADKKEYRKAIKFYFETKWRCLQNNTALLKDIKTII